MTDYKHNIIEDEKNKINLEINKDAPPSLLASHNYISEAEAVRKAWFKHVLLNIEKLYQIVEEVRKEGILNLQTLNNDIKGIADEINKKVDILVNKLSETEVNLKTNTKKPVEFLEKAAIPTIKFNLIMCSVLSGLVGGGLVAIVIFVIKEIFLKK